MHAALTPSVLRSTRIGGVPEQQSFPPPSEPLQGGHRSPAGPVRPSSPAARRCRLAGRRHPGRRQRRGRPCAAPPRERRLPSSLHAEPQLRAQPERVVAAQQRGGALHGGPRHRRARAADYQLHRRGAGRGAAAGHATICVRVCVQLPSLPGGRVSCPGSRGSCRTAAFRALTACKLGFLTPAQNRVKCCRPSERTQSVVCRQCCCRAFCAARSAASARHTLR